MSAAATVDGAARQTLDPDFTIIAAAETKTRLVAALEATESLELDLGSVAEMDTAGLQVLLLLAREAATNGKQLTVVATSKAVDTVLTLAHVTGTLGLTDTQEVQS